MDYLRQINGALSTCRMQLRTATGFASLLLVAPLGACYQPPALTGTDQVHDPNIAATLLKDNGLAALGWPAVDDIMGDVVPSDAEPGCAVGVARGGEVIYLKGYGKAVTGGEDWGVGTMGAVGSVSKTITAAAALRMHELGLLDINATVGNYLSGSNDAIGSLTIHDLMAHSSGVGGATKALAFAPNWEPGSPASTCLGAAGPLCRSVSQLAARPASSFAWFEAQETVERLVEGDPGTGIPDEGVYSNVGYSVLGAVIDSVADDLADGGYEAWVWNHIGQFTDNVLDADNLLSMALTHSWRASDIPHRAVGYTPTRLGFAPAEAFALNAVGDFEGWQGPAGGWAMTIGDLTRLTVALHTNQIVDAGFVGAMGFPWTDLHAFSDHYGLGTFLSSTPGRPPLWHGGDIGGHSAVWGWWDDFAGTGQSLGIAMMCNRSRDSFALADDAVALAKATQGTAPQAGALQVASTPVSPETLNGAELRFNLAKAYQVAPKGVVLPLLLASRLELSLRAEPTSGLSISLGQRRPQTKFTRFETVDLSQNPQMTASARELTLATHLGDVRLQHVRLSGTILKRSLTSASLSATLDTRTVPMPSSDGRDPCRNLTRAGARCTPCDDGEVACVRVRYDGLVAE